MVFTGHDFRKNSTSLTLTRRRILIATGVVVILTILIPPWQNSWGNDDFIAWRLLLRPPITSIPILDYEVSQGRMPPEALSDADTMARYKSGFVAAPADVAWNVLISEWLVLLVCASGFWLTSSPKP